jgi:hypothetical protein
MLISEIKSKIGLEILSKFTTSVSACATLEELKTPTQIMIEQVTALVFPNQRVELLNMEMPQN